jgi:hypothetical protein
MDNVENVKKVLMDHCFRLVEQRMDNAKQAMNAAQESANMEGKSSAGDKYETGRAMAQIERDKAAMQLNEALLLKNSLTLINLKPSSRLVSIGSLVKTDQYFFFIAVSLGRVKVDHVDYFVIAPGTPIGRILIGLTKGSQFSFNGQVHTITEIL